MVPNGRGNRGGRGRGNRGGRGRGRGARGGFDQQQQPQRGRG